MVSSNRFKDLGSRTRHLAEEVGDSWLFTGLAWIILLGLVVALGKVISINVAPYFVLMGSGDDGGWVRHLPLIGYIVRSWGSLVTTISALLVWGLTQALQVLWILVSLDRKAHTNALRESQKFEFGAYTSTSTATQSHDPYVRKMAKRARRIPFFFVRWALFLGLVAYTWDFVIGLLIYPPAESFSAFARAINIGTMGGIDVQNILNLAIMLFSFEALFIPLIVVAQWVWTRRQS